MSNVDTVVLSRKMYDILKEDTLKLEEIYASRRVPVLYVYHAYKGDTLTTWQTENEILKTTLAKNEGLARRNEKLEQMLTKTPSKVANKAPSLRFKLLIGLALAAYTALLIIVF